MKERTYRVLIVEDDPVYRATLSTMIPWARLRCELVAAASTGGQALDILRTCRIDILITDVEMPGMSGVELLVNARALAPGIQCLMLSSFDTFEYVRESLSRGADDYLLKYQVSGETLAQSIRALIEQRGAQEVTSGERSDSGAASLRSMFRRDIVRAIYTGSLDAGQLSEALSTLFPSSEQTRAATICFSICGYRERLSSLPSGLPTGHFVATLLEVIQEAVDPGSVVAEIEENVFAILVAVDPYSTRVAQSARVAAVKSRVIEVARKFFDADLVMLTAEIGSRRSLAETWEKLRGELEGRRFGGTRLVADSSKSDEDSASVVLLELEQERALFELITAGRTVQVADSIRTLFDEAASRGATRSSLLNLANDLTSLGIRVCKNRQIEPREAMLLDSAPPEAMVKAESLEELRNYVIGELERVTECFSSSPIGGNPTLQKALAIIRLRYGEPLTLGSLAEEVGVSSSHLSRMMSTGLGRGFSAELNQVRLDAASRLLEDQSLTAKQVATRCGYTNYTYFFDVFKKRFGVSPQQYRSGKKSKVAH
ncbi:response regulator [Actinomycetaceae bacterium MB13-C1-2]|nr:response regulator [Actinomycetaceae bacterium MB13-C1-2]